MRILITAGPTREPIDAVRFISNRSSGKMGLALLRAAVAAGHEVTLLLGPGVGPGPEVDAKVLDDAVRVYRFNSSADLKQLLEAHFRDCDVLVMAAAVADYRPATVVDGKLPRQPGQPLTLQLEPTPDLVALMAGARRPGQKIIAFALEETEQLEARATQKMRYKHVDAIVANPLSTMDADGITPVWLAADGDRDAPGRMSKDECARWLMEKIAGLMRHQR